MEAMASDDEFLDLDFAVDLAEDDEEATRLAPMTGASAGMFVFEPLGDTATEALQRSGLKVQRATMGSEMMAAAQKRHLQAVIISPTTDPELRELFMRAFRGKFEHVPVVYLSSKTDDPREQAQYRHEGASAVLPWPLPPPGQLVQALQAFIQTPVEVTGADQQHAALAERDEELKVLSRKVSAMERQQRPEAAVPVAELERARRDAEEREREATSLRSELTLVRERSAMLQDRIDRLIADLAAMTRERDEMKLKVDRLEESTDAAKAEGEVVASLRKIGQSTDSFVWGLEQAIQFFEDLQFEAGDKRAPSLKGHIRSLKLVRALLERIRDRLHQL